ncbi:hypothetical protein [Enterococcus faecalis]|uniref:hypothetical protein n=1 Tax=Enterococcus faecalis TaxID=1351 RepID=UPI00035378CF|nr:hypothetical protein [Enterococcus faecalis]EPH73833.1 hypothetical protein D928_00092 [Enterococcus faecalis 20-SD-BW-06]EPI04141.1 hypothetical protein D919_00181 [Enterococcus faecalis 20-SD-BW-08]RBS03292.1 hypothetical protein EA81_00509 [Enterococcus faecalis]TQB08637.1 hypothetical protein FKY93_13485 [Enterococcus faecalis]
MSKQTVNIRAIDTEELFQIIHASNGIYQSTLVKLLQCNRTSLESRLKTLKQNGLIHKKKSNKYFCYTNKYDFQNIQALDKQTELVSLFIELGFYTSRIQVLTNEKKQKQLYLSFFTLGNHLYKSSDKLKNQTRDYHNMLGYNSQKEFFTQFRNNRFTSFPVKISNIDQLYTDNYFTTSLDVPEILVIPTKEVLSSIESKLKDVSYSNRVNKNTEFIREDILIYISSEQKLLYFFKNSQYQYESKEITTPIDFFYYLTKYSYSKNSIYSSNESKDLTDAINLYRISLSNKRKFNTINKKFSKQKAQS